MTVRVVVVGADNLVYNIIDVDQSLVDTVQNNNMAIWIVSNIAQMGWLWDGTSYLESSLSIPPPPVITLVQYRDELDAILREQESARRNAFRDMVLAEADPPITTLAAFRADVEGRNIVWNSLSSTPEA